MYKHEHLVAHSGSRHRVLRFMVDIGANTSDGFTIAAGRFLRSRLDVVTVAAQAADYPQRGTNCNTEICVSVDISVETTR